LNFHQRILASNPFVTTSLYKILQKTNMRRCHPIFVQPTHAKNKTYNYRAVWPKTPECKPSPPSFSFIVLLHFYHPVAGSWLRFSQWSNMLEQWHHHNRFWQTFSIFNVNLFCCSGPMGQGNATHAAWLIADLPSKYIRKKNPTHNIKKIVKMHDAIDVALRAKAFYIFLHSHRSHFKLKPWFSDANTMSHIDQQRRFTYSIHMKFCNSNFILFACTVCGSEDLKIAHCSSLSTWCHFAFKVLSKNPHTW